MTAETRVVLVKPGDVLIFGNVADLDPTDQPVFSDLKRLLGLKRVIVFQDDIDLAAVPQGDGA